MQIIGITIGWIHIMATAIAIGGSYVLHFIIDKVADDMDPAEGGKLKGAVGPLFGKIAAIMTLLVIVTGVMRSQGMGLLNPSVLLDTGYGNLLSGKIVIVTIITVNSVLLARNGIRAGALASADGAPDTTTIDAIGKQQKMLGMSNFILASIAVGFAVAMRFIGAPEV